MRCSIRLNNDLTPAQYVELAKAAERSGFDQIWVSNDLFLRSAPVVVGTMLAATQRLEVGIGILNPYTLHAAEIAMLASTLDETFGNRFNLGLAAGATDFLGWVGIEQQAPLATMREAVATIRALQRGDKAPSGERLRATDQAYLRFAAPRLTPIYVGAMGPKMLELAGEIGDGALPLLFPPEHYYEVRERMAPGEARRVPDLGPVDVAACFWISVDADGDAARRVLAEKIAYYGHALSPLILKRLGLERTDFDEIRHLAHDEDDLSSAAGLVTEEMMAIGIAGDASTVRDRLRPFLAAGAEHLSFGPPLGPDPVRSLELLGEGVVEALRSESGPSLDPPGGTPVVTDP